MGSIPSGHHVSQSFLGLALKEFVHLVVTVTTTDPYCSITNRQTRLILRQSFPQPRIDLMHALRHA
jgi:hypothetical protein